MAQCKTCGGTGSFKCDKCDGLGHVAGPGLSGARPCSSCGGSGKFTCQNCKGTGVQPGT